MSDADRISTRKKHGVALISEAEDGSGHRTVAAADGKPRRAQPPVELGPLDPGRELDRRDRGGVHRAGGRVLWDSAESVTIELTSNEAENNRFVAEVSNFGEVLEVVRSGALAIQKGKEVLES